MGLDKSFLSRPLTSSPIILKFGKQTSNLILFMKNKEIQIAPSILAGDFGHLADEAKRLEQAGADAIHIDIMDGHFVPNLTLGPKAVESINKSTDLFLDVHLMIYNPFAYIERFVEAGADRITFHFEATEDIEDTLNFIRKCNVEVGLAFKPETSSSFILKYLDKCDLILLMTVNPGFGGQKFMEEVLEKVTFTSDVLEKYASQKKPWLQVDGGINLETFSKCRDAGANSFVVGTHLFSKPDMKKGIQDLKDS